MAFVVTGDALANFISYLQQNGLPYQYVHITGTNPSDPQWSITYGPQVTQAQKDSIANLIANPAPFGTWNPTFADYNGFLTDCLTDSNAPNYPIALIYCSALANSAITGAQRASVITAAQTSIKANYPSNATAIINQIAAYMTARHIPTS